MPAVSGARNAAKGSRIIANTRGHTESNTEVGAVKSEFMTPRVVAEARHYKGYTRTDSKKIANCYLVVTVSVRCLTDIILRRGACTFFGEVPPQVGQVPVRSHICPHCSG